LKECNLTNPPERSERRQSSDWR